jgi:ferritin
VSEKTFDQLLPEQVAYEFGAEQQYIAIAVHYDAQTMPQLASFFYRQAIEERNHAMMIIQYMLDANMPVEIPGVAGPRNEFPDIVAPIALALEQEKRVTEQINAIAAAARAEGNYQGEQFMQWFLKEQTEEVASMGDLLTIVERAKDDPMRVEDWLAREKTAGQVADPTAPAAAGGAI